MQLELKHIKSILVVEKGLSCWAVQARQADQIPQYPDDANVIRLAEDHLGGPCCIHDVSGQGDWTNQLVLILPTGTRPKPRQAFIHALGERTPQLADASDTRLLA